MDFLNDYNIQCWLFKIFVAFFVRGKQIFQEYEGPLKLLCSRSMLWTRSLNYSYWNCLIYCEEGGNFFCHQEIADLVNVIYFYFNSCGAVARRGHGFLIDEVSISHTTTYHGRQDFSGRVISSSQRPLPDNTQRSQRTSIPSVGFEPTISAGERL
jgi:hypothetical protein